MTDIVKDKIPIRRSGGSSIVSIPKDAMDRLGLAVGNYVKLSVQGRKLILEPSDDDDKLSALLKGVTSEQLKPTEEEKEWMNSTAGKELV